MKALKWIVVLMVFLLGACSKTDAETGPIEENPVEQVPVAQNSSNTSAPVPAKSPLKILSLTVVPEVVDVGHPAVIVVTVNNTAKEFGTYPVELKIDGNPYATQTVALPAGASANVTFDITPINERNLLLVCGDLFRELIIQHS